MTVEKLSVCNAYRKLHVLGVGITENGRPVNLARGEPTA